MAFGTALSAPFHRGVNISALVPEYYDAAINGLVFRFDTADEAMKSGPQSLSMLRNQIDSSNQGGEQSINREDLWRRAQTSWHRGAGQLYFDRDDSDAQRFYKSKGLDVWTRGELKLLPNTTKPIGLNSGDSQLITVGDRVYASAATQGLYQSTSPTDPTSWSNIPAGSSPIRSLATDGYNLWIVSADGLLATTRGSSVVSPYGNNPGGDTYYLAAYAKGRLFAASRQFLYNITAAGAAPTPLNNLFGNSDFRWVDIVEGPNHIFAAGFSGDQSVIYRIAIADDGTTLDPPVAAASLPAGETARSMYGYLGFLFIGTDQGVRVAQVSETGVITMGALIKTESPVLCFAGKENFVWFGLSNYDGDSTGVGRIDLTQEIEPLQFAWATDLMAPRQGAVSALTRYGDRIVFMVDSDGLWVQGNGVVSSGTLDTGRITFGLSDPKVATGVVLRHNALQGGVSIDISPDGGDFMVVGSNTLQQTTEPVGGLEVSNAAGEYFNVRITLSAATSGVTGPVLTRMQLRGYPLPERGYTIMAPLLLADRQDDVALYRHPLDDFEAIRSLVSYRKPVRYQELGLTFDVIVDDYVFHRETPTKDRRWWNGVLVTRLKVFPQ